MATKTHPLQKNPSTATVIALYHALTAGESKKVAEILGATDLEWWFHGPQNCHHMMKFLTGEAPSFIFEPKSITTFDDFVIIEGWEGAKAYWVHVWTLKDGMIVKFREYFNTWLTVTELGGGKSPTRWQSQPLDLARRSFTGLVLAI